MKPIATVCMADKATLRPDASTLPARLTALYLFLVSCLAAVREFFDLVPLLFESVRSDLESHFGTRARRAVRNSTFLKSERAQMGGQGAITAVITIGATLVIGIYVISSIIDGTPDPTNTDLNNSQQNVVDTLSSAMDLGAVLPIVVIAVAILGFLTLLGSGGMRR